MKMWHQNLTLKEVNSSIITGILYFPLSVHENISNFIQYPLLYHLNENVIAHPTQISVLNVIRHFIAVLIVNTSIQKQMHISCNWNIWDHQLWYWSGIEVNILRSWEV